MTMVVGDFSVSANTGGWQSRGTLIADRQTQLMITDFFQEELCYAGGDAVWDRLISNLLSGWENDDDDDSRRRLYSNGITNALGMMPAVETLIDYVHPHADCIEGGFVAQNHQDPPRDLPFELTPDPHRKLKNQSRRKQLRLALL